MLSGGSAMLDFGESLKIDELARSMSYEADSVSKEQLRDATCHIKQVVGPKRSEQAAQVFLGAVSLCTSMPDAAQVESIQRFLLGLSGLEDESGWSVKTGTAAAY